MELMINADTVVLIIYVFSCCLSLLFTALIKHYGGKQLREERVSYSL